jgi:hypothetical protein
MRKYFVSSTGSDADVDVEPDAEGLGFGSQDAANAMSSFALQTSLPCGAGVSVMLVLKVHEMGCVVEVGCC